MKIFDQQRGTGKTYNLIKESINTGVPILCTDYAHVRSIQAQSAGNFSELCNTIMLAELRGKQTNLIVDDIEWLCTELLRKHYGFTGDLTCISVSRDD